MADLGTVHPIAAGLQGIQAGIQNAGQLYGLMRQKKRDEMEESLMPLKRQALEQEVDRGKITGEKAGLELQSLKDYNTPLKFDEVMQPFREADKIGTTMAEEIATKGGYLDPTNRTIKKGDLAKVRELSSTPEMMKQRALLNLQDINATLKTVKPEDPAFAQLTEKKNYLEKMYKLEEDFEAVPVWNDKSRSWEWVNKKNGQPAPTLAGKTPKEVQVELLKEKAADDKAADTEKARNERARLDREAANKRAAEANASRDRAAAGRNAATAATATERKEASTEKAAAKKVQDKIRDISTYIYANYDKKIEGFKKELAKVEGVDGKETSAANLKANIESHLAEREKAIQTQNLLRDGAIKPEDVKFSGGTIQRPTTEHDQAAEAFKAATNPATKQAIRDAYKKNTGKDLGL